MVDCALNTQYHIVSYIAGEIEIFVLCALHGEFSYELIGERILRIGPHLPKLLTNIKWLTFFETPCSCYLKRIGLRNVVMRTLPRQFTECDIVTRYVTLSNCVTSLTNNLYRSEVIDC